MKEIDSQFYCKPKEELGHVTCKGEGCNKIFVTKEDYDKWTDKDYTPVVPTGKNVVRACFNVLECGHAFCNDRKSSSIFIGVLHHVYHIIYLVPFPVE